MRFISWNVNGIRAVMKKGFQPSFESMHADVICIQETKAQDDQVAEAVDSIKGYRLYSNSAVKKGYSGTAILTKHEPSGFRVDMGLEEHDQEGRVIALEFTDYFLVNVYTPNSGSDLNRLDYRSKWDADFLAYIKKLEGEKPVILCGDLNVAHKEIDLARPKPNYNKTAGYMQEEIDGMDNIVAANFVDTFRHQNPETIKYSWWSYRAGARQKNVGWRIDYFLVSPSLVDGIQKTDLLNNIMGSDHCPVLLDLES